MFGLDDMISGLNAGGGLAVVLAIALLLGLRHATDPDHLVAVSTLLATEPDRPARRASRLGLSWGLGHATSLLALGLPVVLIDKQIPRPVHASAEILIGIVIMVLAVRLFRHWRNTGLHVHAHTHEGIRHRHLHGHEDAESHEHDHRLTRSPMQAYGIGLIHGIAGSAAVTVLLLASISDRAEAILALATFAVGTAVSMSLLSLGIGYALVREPVRARLNALAPALVVLSFAFGAWYGLYAAVTFLTA
jgi:ABC-type nickel/cobalt efflux system permease component RcnA